MEVDDEHLLYCCDQSCRRRSLLCFHMVGDQQEWSRTMTDIVKRLRDESLRQQVGGHSGAFYDELADEFGRLKDHNDFLESANKEQFVKIERLRWALVQISEMPLDEDTRIVRGVARRALGGGGEDE